MKQVVLIIFILYSGVNSMAQELPKGWLKQTESRFKPIPGTALFASETECSVSEYQLFLAASEANSKNYLYDSMAWESNALFKAKGAYNTPITYVYYNHPIYKNYAVVNVTKAAAMAYCEWLTQTYNAQPGRKYKKVEFRLPRTDEWTKAALGRESKEGEKKIFPWYGIYPRNAKGVYLANYAPSSELEVKRNAGGELEFIGKRYSPDNLMADGSMYVAAPKAYAPNDFGLYHMAGNVSEFTLEAGKAMGGSYISPLWYLQVRETEPEFADIDKGAPFVGFRPFMVIVEP